MKYRHAQPILVAILALIITGASTSFAGDEPFTRRTYRLGDTISQVASTAYPDEKDWPGGRLFFSSDQTVVWGTDGWVPIAEIREAMHPSWKKDPFANWVPIKDIQEILPLEFTPEDLAGDPEPYRIDKNHTIKKVKEKDLEKYADVLQYQHPPKADLPSTSYYGPWADAGVIRGQIFYPRVDRKYRADGKPVVSFSNAGLWLGDQWNTTTFYFFQPDEASEPILFYVETTGHASGFDRIKALFVEAFGAPSSTTSEPVQNRMGAVYQNEIIEYRNDSSSMILTKYDADLDTGSVVHVFWPVYNALKSKLDLAKGDAASRL
jgi:hypothetical protein